MSAAAPDQTQDPLHKFVFYYESVKCSVSDSHSFRTDPDPAPKSQCGSGSRIHAPYDKVSVILSINISHFSSFMVQSETICLRLRKK